MDSSLARTQELWPALKQRLDSVRMQSILGGAGRIYKAPPDDFSRPEGAESSTWGRGVIVPTTRIWYTEENPETPRQVGFLLRFEFNAIPREDYDPTVPLEAAHVEAFLLLQRHAPTMRADGNPFRHLTVSEAVYRHTAPSDPVHDRERNLWIASAEYRCRISNDSPPS